MLYQIIPVTSYQQNCSLIWCETTNKAALIDPGGESDKLLSIIAEKGLELDKVILTHGHLDHVGGAAIISKQCGVPIIGPHKDDAFWLEWIPGQIEMFNFPPSEIFSPAQWLTEGDKVSVGNISLEVIHCPGHTPGHIVLQNISEKVLFGGDIIFKGSIGRTDFPKGDHDQLISSIKQKLFVLDDETTIIPGHGPTTTIGEEKRSNSFLI